MSRKAKLPANLPADAAGVDQLLRDPGARKRLAAAIAAALKRLEDEDQFQNTSRGKGS
jgi:hypothetical protein